MAARHIAAMIIQRWYLRYDRTVRTKKQRQRHLQAREKGEIWISPWTIWAKTHSISRHQQPLAAKYFLQSGQYHTNMGTRNYTFAFKEWCAKKIQEAWRYRRRKRWLKFQVHRHYQISRLCYHMLQLTNLVIVFCPCIATIYILFSRGQYPTLLA